MKKLTGTSLALALTCTFGATSALASTLEDRDMAFAFGSENTMEVATLSEQEMRETEGAVVPWRTFAPAGGGAALGSGIYAGNTIYNSWDGRSNYGFNKNTLDNFKNNWSYKDMALSAGAGAISGAYSSAMLGGLGYNGVANQLKAPLMYQAPIRANGAGIGYGAVGVYKNTPPPISNSYSSTYGNSYSYSNSYGGAGSSWSRPTPW